MNSFPKQSILMASMILLCCLAINSQTGNLEGNGEFKIIETRDSGRIGPRLMYVQAKPELFEREKLAMAFDTLTKSADRSLVRITISTRLEDLARVMAEETKIEPHVSREELASKLQSSIDSEIRNPSNKNTLRAIYRRSKNEETFVYRPNSGLNIDVIVTLYSTELFDDSNESLFRAVKSGYALKVNELLTALKNVNVIDKEGYSPLSWAVALGQDGIAKALITAGAKINHATRSGVTPLMFAADTNNESLVRLLLANNVVVDSIDSEGRSALMAAVLNCSPTIISLLVRNRAIRSSDQAKYFKRLSHSCSDEIQKLIEGADPLKASSSSEPLH